MYQSGRTVGATLRSLLKQSFTNIEIIVVDDGSTDDGPAIAAEAARNDSRVRVITQANGGLSAARNSGIAESRAELIGFCDADDLWEPTKVSRHVEFLAMNPAVGISFAGSVVVDGELRPTGGIRCPAPGCVDLKDLLWRNPIGNGSTVIGRKACFDSVRFENDASGGRSHCWFDERLRQCEDIDMWCRVSAGGEWQIAGIPIPLTAYRVHAGSLSGNANRMMASWREVRDRIQMIAPDVVAQIGPVAEASQWIWHARKAAASGDGWESLRCSIEAFKTTPRIVIAEPFRTLQTAVVATILAAGGALSAYLIQRAFGWKRRMAAPMDWITSSAT